ncbi:MAG TPA: hypothetical protein DCY02_03605, partial [Armatimonadetes bacterium]|nr:hypothetical protein [Armatimonadota bacterium]
KNKIAPPFRTTEFDIIFGKGISRAGDLLDLSVEHGFVNRAGTYFNYKDERLAQGRENARAALLSKPEVMEELERDLKAKLMPARLEAPIEEPEDDDI